MNVDKMRHAHERALRELGSYAQLRECVAWIEASIAALDPVVTDDGVRVTLDTSSPPKRRTLGGPYPRPIPEYGVRRAGFLDYAEPAAPLLYFESTNETPHRIHPGN